MNRRASSRSPGAGLGRVQDDLDVHADALATGGISASSECNPVVFLLFSSFITYPCSILA